MVGSALVRKLKADGYKTLLFRAHKELDLLDHHAVNNFFSIEKPDYVFIAAAKVGGIQANNTYRGQFLYENLMIQNNIIHEAHKNSVKKLLFLGSACIYPRNAPQPIKEEYLLSDKLEPTNEPYAIAKIAGIKLCENYYHQYGNDFISVMPNNLYGPNDNFDPLSSHTIPANIRKVVERQDPLVIWSDGKGLRDYIHASDLANGMLLCMEKYAVADPVNIATGKSTSVNELIKLMCEIDDFKNPNIEHDLSQPGGPKAKLLNFEKAKKLLGYAPKITLKDGLTETINWFKNKSNF